MTQSHVVEVNGTFVGAAIATPGGLQFHAVHAKLETLEAGTWESLDEIRRAARQLLITDRLATSPWVQ